MSQERLIKPSDITTPKEAKLFCGLDITVRSSDYSPRSMPWNSNDYLANVGRTGVLSSSETAENLRPMLWNDLCSEYDAENFCKYLERSGLELSPAFKSFEGAWRKDEYNHYLGFLRIYSRLYDEPEEEVAKRLEHREADFKPIDKFLKDEFTIALLLAYDEIATAKAYSQDHELYASFEDPNYLRWIKLVTRDESIHFTNLTGLINQKHPDRIPEVSQLVSQFIEWDLEGGEYKGTFVLDHEGGDYFTPEFLRDCGRIINHALDPKKPKTPIPNIANV